MAAQKRCFFNQDRPCDLTCKAAFEVDDPVDNVDCYFIWLAHHIGEGLFDVHNLLEAMGGPSGPGGFSPGGGGSPGPGPASGPSTGPRPKSPKDFPDN